MDGDTRRKLTMAATVVDFIKHQPPSTDAGFNTLVADLEQLVARSADAAQQQRDARTAHAAATRRRNSLRRQTLRDQTRYLVRIARRTAATNPAFAGHFVMPQDHGPLGTFITAANVLLATARTERDLLVSAGLTITALDDLQASIDLFDDETVRQHDAHLDRVSARIELLDIAAECVELSKALDSYFRLEFAGHPERLAAWRSASHVPQPHRRANPAPAATPRVFPVVLPWRRVARD